MQTQFMWDDLLKAKEVPFDLTEKEVDCVRIERGDNFEVWVPNKKKDGGSVIYQLRVSEVEYHFNQTYGDPEDVIQYVFLRPIPE